MFLAGREFINNDGLHAPTAVYSSAALKEGYYPIEIKFFEAGGGEKLELVWKQGGTEYAKIPASCFFH